MKLLTILLLLLSSAPAFAGDGGLSGGATELTQLANNSELVVSSAAAVKSAAADLEVAYNTYQQLKNFDPGTIAQMSGIPIEQVKVMADAYEVFNKAQGAYQDASNTLNRVQGLANSLKMSPGEVLRMAAQVARQKGGVYQSNYDKEAAKINKARDMSGAVSDAAKKVGAIDSTVGGVQFLATQGAQTQGVLINISDSIATANTMAAAKAAQEEIDKSEYLEELGRRQEAFDKAKQRASGTMPLPNEIKLRK